MVKLILFIILLSSCSSQNFRELSSYNSESGCLNAMSAILEKKDTNPIVNFFTSFFKSTAPDADEAMLLLEEEARDIVLNQTPTQIKEAFLKFASENNVLFEERDGSFIILPDRNSSLLNRFVDSVQRIKKINQDKGIHFIFDPKMAKKMDGGYSTKEGKIKVSLKAIANGSPSFTEIHEILHLENDFAFEGGKDVLMRAAVLPNKLPYVGKTEYAYANGFFLDELETHASDIRLHKRLLKRYSGLSRQTKKILLKRVRLKIEILGEIEDVLEREFNEYLKRQSSFDINLKFSMNKTRSGIEYARLFFNYVDLFRIDISDPEIVSTVKYVLENANVVNIDQEMKRLRTYYLERIAKLRELHNKSYPLIKKIIEKSKSESYLISDEFQNDLAEYRELVRVDFK